MFEDFEVLKCGFLWCLFFIPISNGSRIERSTLQVATSCDVLIYECILDNVKSE